MDIDEIEAKLEDLREKWRKETDPDKKKLWESVGKYFARIKEEKQTVLDVQEVFFED